MSSKDQECEIDNSILIEKRVIPVAKSESQLERERWLLPNLIEFNRWFLMPAAVTTQFCCGSLYAWSVFNKPIDMLVYGKNSNMAPIAFYIAVGCFGISTALCGPWLERRGPLICCLIGSSLFYLGNLLTALALYLKQMWLVFLGYGVICGLALGCCYICPVSALQKWFPDKRGLAAGFAVCGFGAGSIVISKIQIPLMTTVGLPWTFVILGSSYFILMATSSLVLRTPPNCESIENGTTATITTTKDTLEHLESPSTCSSSVDIIKSQLDDPVSTPTVELTLIECLTSKDFRLMYMMLLSNGIFGLVVISRLSNMVTDIFFKTPEEASTVVSINGGFNLGGRLLLSILSDFVGRKSCYFFMLTSQLIIVAVFSTITSTGTYWAFLLTMWFLTGCYGAGWGVIPAYLSDRFGSRNIGACHGIILTGWSLAGVCGGLTYTAVFNAILEAGYTPNNAYCYWLNAWWIFGIINWMDLPPLCPTN